tara:strand:- start:193 stop:402 length:210 start_codon:yes stop_codon:yes gene_type:complete
MIGDIKNKIYMLTIEYNSETEEIEYVAEEIIDNRLEEEVDHVGDIDLEDRKWDIRVLEYMRNHYTSGKS